jgi:hypothetical protein
MGWLVPEGSFLCEISSGFPSLHIYTGRSYTGANGTRPMFVFVNDIGDHPHIAHGLRNEVVEGSE